MGWGGVGVVGVGIFHKRDDIILPIRLPQEQGYASISSFYISAGSHIFVFLFFFTLSANSGGRLL